MDEETGTVTLGESAQAGDECAIYSRVEAPGHDAKELEAVTLTVEDFLTLSWDTFPTTARLGVDIDLNNNQPVFFLEPDTVTITAPTAGCSYSGGILSFTNVDECQVVVTASKANYVDVEETFRITPVAGDLGDIAWGAFSGRLVVGGSTATPTAPSVSEPGVSVSYRIEAGSKDICELVDPSTGEVRAIPVASANSQYCELVATASKQHYASQSETISIRLRVGSLGNVRWGRFDGSLKAWGISRVPSAPTAVRVDDVTFTYALKSSTAANCTLLDTATGRVRANVLALSGGEECTLVITASKLGYTSKSGEISVPVAAGTQHGVVWSPGTLTFQTSSSPVTLGAVQGHDARATVTYAVNQAGTTGCRFADSTSSALSFTAAGTCTIQASVDIVGAATLTFPEMEVVISDAAPTGITWSGYANSNVVALSGSAIEPAPAPSGSGSYYTSAVPESVCTVDPQARLTTVARGTCYVTVGTTEGNGGKVTIAVVIKGLLDFSLVGAPSFGESVTSLPLGIALDMENITSIDDEGVPVSWSFSVAGTRSGSSQSGVCTVDNDSNSRTFGQIRSDSSAQVGDICTVTMTASHPHFEDYVTEVPLTLRNRHALAVTGLQKSYCALFEGGSVKCWGNNAKGQLGIGNNSGNKANMGDHGSEMGSNLPFLNFGTGRSAVQISMGAQHACAVLDNGELKCWGEGDNKRLGTGNNNDKKTPGVANNLGGAAKQVSAGYAHTCAVLVNGTLKCWGFNNHGQVGAGSQGADQNYCNGQLGPQQGSGGGECRQLSHLRHCGKYRERESLPRLLGAR